MDGVRDLLIMCWDQVRDLARGISESFTGADSSAMLVMLIFYLILAIIIVLLLLLLTRSIRSLFAALFGRTRKKRKNDTALYSQPAKVVEPAEQAKLDNTPYNEALCVHGNPCQHGCALFSVESFDGKTLLDRLSSRFNSINNKYKATFSHHHIDENIPSHVNPVDEAGDHILTEDETASILLKIDGHDLKTLQHMFGAEVSKESEIAEKIKVISRKLFVTGDERDKLSAEEAAVLEKYNAAVDEIQTLSERSEHLKELLSVEYSKIFKKVSNFIAERNTLLSELERLCENLVPVPSDVDTFGDLIEHDLNGTYAEYVKKDEVLSALRSSYGNIHESRVRADEIICSLEGPLAVLYKEKAIQTAMVAQLRSRIDELEAQEAARLAAEEAARLAAEEAARIEREEAERRAKEEAERLAREEEERRKTADLELNAVMGQVQRQAQEAYALNYDDISPDMYEKIAAVRRKNMPPKACEGAVSGQESRTNNSANPSVSSESAHAAEQGSVNETPSKPDYFAELKQEWAAEREHKEQWRAELEQKRADEERRKKELTKSFGKNACAGTGNE